MRLSSIIHLYRVRLRSRLVQELLALAGITVGVALVFAALVANTSLTGSVRQLTDSIMGHATLQLAGRGSTGFDQRLVADARDIEGVKAVAPIIETRANLVGPNGRRSVLLIGGDSRFAGLGGSMLPHFTKDGLGQLKTLGLPTPMATTLGIALGQPIRVEIDSRTVSVPLGAQLARGEIGALVQSPVALMSLSVAQRLSGMTDRVSRVFVEPLPGREDEVETGLRRLAGDRLNVLPADSEVAVFEQAAYPTNQSTALFSVFSALVGFLFAFSAVLLTVPQRRRLISDLRMAGHEPWVLVQLLLFDALVLGIAGAGAGLLLGDQLSRHLFDTTPGYLSSAFPVGTQRIVAWQTIAIAGGAGIVAACVAVLAPLNDILARHPRPAVSSVVGARSERWTAAAGIVCLLLTTAIIVLVPDAAMVGIVSLTLAFLLLLPMLLCLVTSAFELVGRLLKSPVPILAILELRSRAAHMRTLALAATGGVAVFATVAIGGAHADLERGLNTSAREIDGNADIWVTFQGAANMLATTPFASPRETAAVKRLPGVRDVSAYRGSFLDVGDHRAWVLAPSATTAEPIPPSQIRHGERSLATARIRRGGWVSLSEAIADEHGVGVGDRVTLPSPVPTAFRVAAVSTNLAWPPGAIVLNADDYERAWGSRAVSALQVDVDPGASVDRVAHSIRQTLGPQLPLRVETKRQRTERHYGTARDALSRLTQISVLVLISAVLAMAAAMGGMIWQRRPTLAALKVHGYPEVELWRALLLESGLLLGTGCLIGALFGLYGQILLSRALESITGFPVIYSAAGLGALAILALVTVVAVTVLAIPGWFAVRIRPAPGIPG